MAVSTQTREGRDAEWRRTLRRVPVAAWAVAALIYALVSPSIGAAILPTHTVREWIRNHITERPSAADKAVSRYANEVRRALPWERTPTLSQPSLNYFRTHFASLDPTRAHPFPAVDRQQPIPFDEVLTGSPALAGRPIATIGNLAQDPTLVTTGRTSQGAIASTAFFLRDKTLPRTLLACRAPINPKRTRRLPQTGDRVAVAGVIVAEGALKRLDGRGFEHVVYMACSAISPTLRITFKVK